MIIALGKAPAKIPTENAKTAAKQKNRLQQFLVRVKDFEITSRSESDENMRTRSDTRVHFFFFRYLDR